MEVWGSERVETSLGSKQNVVGSNPGAAESDGPIGEYLGLPL